MSGEKSLSLSYSWTVAYQALPPWDFPGKSTGVGCHFLLQGIFPTQGLNPGLPHCRLYHSTIWATREIIASLKSLYNFLNISIIFSHLPWKMNSLSWFPISVKITIILPITKKNLDITSRSFQSSNCIIASLGIFLRYSLCLWIYDNQQ